jgi:hypothetical protein
MTWIVLDVSGENITIRALRCRFAVEAGTLGSTRDAHGAGRYARHTLNRPLDELPYPLGRGEYGERALRRE